MTSLIELIQQRQSTPLVTTPAPSQEEWTQVIQAGAAAPDHGKLQPWQFRLIEGESLHKLGALFVAAHKKHCALKGTQMTEQQAQRTQGLPSRAPAILLVVAKIQENHKIPIIEQISATAAATQNIQLALMDLGYGCIWRTGDFAFYDEVKIGLGFSPKDEIIGFLYVGTAQKQLPVRVPQDIQHCFKPQEW